MSKITRPDYITFALLFALLLGSGIFYFSNGSFSAKQTPSTVTTANTTHAGIPSTKEEVSYPGPHVVVFLDEMRLELRESTTTLESVNLISIGKPGSYYETLGGTYVNDYEIRNHFSSIGHVYMPWSVHIFGNYFIHGIPYYPNGEKVSSEYSGGCIRLSDKDAERVYDFVSRGTPIIVTNKNMNEFQPTATSTDTFTSMEMTRYMATIVSLEVLAQDKDIKNVDGTVTTRRKLIPRLLGKEDGTVIAVIARAVGNENFVDYMNKKALSLGLSNTTFATINNPATTTEEDLSRLKWYVTEYKSYLLKEASSTTESSR